MDYISGQDRNQLMMITWEQMVDSQSFARIIYSFVDALGLDSFGFDNSKLKEEGQPPFHSLVFLKLYLCVYQFGIQYSDQLVLDMSETHGVRKPIE